jgi:hypothetical protein
LLLAVRFQFSRRERVRDKKIEEVAAKMFSQEKSMTQTAKWAIFE